MNDYPMSEKDKLFNFTIGTGLILLGIYLLKITYITYTKK